MHTGPGTSLGFLGQNFVPRSDIESVWLGRHGLRTNEKKCAFAALADTTRSRGVITFLSSYIESTPNLGSIGYLSNIDLKRSKTEPSSMGLTADSSQKSE